MDNISESDQKHLRSLEEILFNVKPVNQTAKKVSRFPFLLSSPVDCDEVYPNVFIGNEGAARCKEYLRSNRINYILNCADGTGFGKVHSGLSYYEGMNIEYGGISLDDLPTEKIGRFFELGANFIDQANSKGGRILVHCMMGISRSATIVCAFLMMKRGMTAEQALTVIRRRREVFPNYGFLYELINLEKRLMLQKDNTSV